MDTGVPKFTYTLSSLYMNSTTILCGVATIIAGILWNMQRQSRLPPGPPVYIPGLGHLLKLAKNPLQEFRTLRRTYGDIFKIHMGTRVAVVLNGYDVINEVLQTRGPEFSHRPSSFLAEKLAEYKGFLNTSGKAWMEQKTNVMKTLRILSSTGGHVDQYLEKEVNRLTDKLSALVKNGQARDIDVAPYIRKSICSTAFSVVFGRELDYDSKELKLFSDSLEELFGCLGSLAVVNFIPFIHLLPGDPVYYHRSMQVARVIEDELIKPEIKRLTEIHNSHGVDSNRCFQEAINSFWEQELVPSLVGGYIAEMKKKYSKGICTEMNDEHLVKTAGDLMAGGYDTVSNTLQWLVVYLIHKQDVQERCRKEVLRALDGYDGNITRVDRSELIYTQATIMEVQRLSNIGPFPPAHTCDHDTTIRGYHIPKDTLLMINMDSLMIGPHVGDDPEQFRPERFISDEGQLVHHKWFLPFSTGTRMCIGANIARKELLTVTASLLSKFRFSAPVSDGHTNMPSLEGILGLTHVPKPFTVCLESVTL